MISLIKSWISNIDLPKGCKFLCLLALFLAMNVVRGQEIIDTAVIAEELVYEKENSFKSVFYGQPGKAALYSLIVPGGGQLYNKRWWKVPLVWAGEGFLISNLIGSINNFQNWENCRLGFLDPDVTPVCDQIVNSFGQNVDVTTTSEAFDQQQAAKAAKERAWLFVIAGHLIQTLEAFVDRHLINFNTEDQLSHLRNPQQSLMGSSIATSSSVTVFSVSINLNRLAD